MGSQFSEGSDDLSQDFSFGKHPVSSSSSSDNDISEDEDNSAEKVPPSKKRGGGGAVEPDSSYYSVNKFNFLFYFVYKLKYMDDEYEEEQTERAQEE